MSLGQKIADNRRKKGWKKSELAEKCEVTKKTVVKWEADEKEPSIAELIKLSDLFGITIDDLVQNQVALDKKRENFFHPLCRNIGMAMSRLYDLEGRYQGPEWSRKSDDIMILEYFYDIASYRFISGSGHVYDKYLVKNSDEESRFRWVQFINGTTFAEKDGPFKDYIEGKCEIDECFRRLEKKLKKEFDDVHAGFEKKKESENCEVVDAYKKIGQVLGSMRMHEKFSEKSVDEKVDTLDTLTSKLSSEPFMGEIFNLWCTELKKAWDDKDYEKITKLGKEHDALREYVWSKIPEPKEE